MQKIARHLIYTHKLSESFYVANMSVLRKKIFNWEEQLPNVRPFYAVKCNPDKEIMKEMLKKGVGFDVASRREIDAALAAGANPGDDIIFANPVKRRDDLEYATGLGVVTTTFDSIHELQKIEKNAHTPRVKALLRLRINNPTARIQLGTKYGVGWDEYKEIIDKAKGKEVGVDIAGVSFHVGSASQDPFVFREALVFSKIVIDYARQAGFNMRILDIGGGFTGAGFNDCARILREDLVNFPDMQVIAEPGRYFAEDVFTFFTPVIGQRERRGKREYWIGDGLYGSLNCVLYDEQIPEFKVLRNPLLQEDCKLGYDVPSIIQGATCDSRDTLEKTVMLPRLRDEDFLMIPRFGAYTLAGACDFNGISMTNPRIFYLDGHELT